MSHMCIRWHLDYQLLRAENRLSSLCQYILFLAHERHLAIVITAQYCQCFHA